MASCTSSGAFLDLDDETAALILRLELEDTEELMRTTRVSSPSSCALRADIGFALQAQKAELERSLSTIADRRMTSSIRDAVLADGPVIDATLRRERGEVVDRVSHWNLVVFRFLHKFLRGIVKVIVLSRLWYVGSLYQYNKPSENYLTSPSPRCM